MQEYRLSAGKTEKQMMKPSYGGNPGPVSSEIRRLILLNDYSYRGFVLQK